MKIRATRNFLNDIGMVRRGAEVDIRDVQAKSLIERGLASAVESDEPEPKPQPKPKGIKSATGASASTKGE